MESILDLIPPEKPFEKTIDCVYSLETREVIKIYKQSYITQTTSEARKQIFRTQVLPAIFRHWQDNGKTPENSDESAARIKVGILITFYK